MACVQATRIGRNPRLTTMMWSFMQKIKLGRWCLYVGVVAGWVSAHIYYYGKEVYMEGGRSGSLCTCEPMLLCLKDTGGL